MHIILIFFMSIGTFLILTALTLINKKRNNIKVQFWTPIIILLGAFFLVLVVIIDSNINKTDNLNEIIELKEKIKKLEEKNANAVKEDLCTLHKLPGKSSELYKIEYLEMTIGHLYKLIEKFEPQENKEDIARRKRELGKDEAIKIIRKIIKNDLWLSDKNTRDLFFYGAASGMSRGKYLSQIYESIVDLGNVGFGFSGKTLVTWTMLVICEIKLEEKEGK